MARPSDLSDAQIILLAVNLCVAGEIEGLRALALQVPDVLAEELLLRILLTYLPATTDPHIYSPLLRLSTTQSPETNSEVHIDASSVNQLKDRDIEEQVENLGLASLQLHTATGRKAPDALTAFLLHRAYQIDWETRNLPVILKLVEPFIDQLPFLRQWVVSILLPLWRSEYEYYPQDPLGVSMPEFEGLDPRAAINMLLQRRQGNTSESYIARDLRCLVGPWMHGENRAKRRKLSYDDLSEPSTSATTGSDNDEGWSEVNDWLLTRSLEDFSLAQAAFLNWDGPSDVDLGGFSEERAVDDVVGQQMKAAYIQVGLSMAYTSEDASQETIDGLWKILARAKQLLDMEWQTQDRADLLPNLSSSSSQIADLSKASLFRNAILNSSNPLTKPTSQSLSFLEGVLTSTQIFKHLGMPITCRQVTELSLFASEDVQKQELHRLLQGVAKLRNGNSNWEKVRNQITWLRTWDNNVSDKNNHEHRAPFWRVDGIFMHQEFLDALLSASQHQLAVELYLHKHDSQPLTRAQIEEVVESVILRNYDNASNGNRTRGGMKRASDILKTFQSYIGRSSSIHNVEHLLSATHSLSFYHLTLQHGVPFQPVSIRIHSDPIALIGKVLEQNPKAYTQLDDLISIGQNFVKAGLPVGDSQDAKDMSNDRALLEAQRRITYIAMESALLASDFDTAWSYIVTRLTPPDSQRQSSSFSDDYSWRAAYLAGRNRPKQSSTAIPLSAQISSLSKRMELLSLALRLAPSPDPLPEILGTWRRCEEELNSLKSTEAEEEAAWDARGDHLVPGGFGPEGRDEDIEETRRERARRFAERKQTRQRAAGYEEEAPMGLFDVARGAARAIGKSAFPLRSSGAGGPSTGAKGFQIHNQEPTHGEDTTRTSSDMERSFISTGSGEGHRVRKRDMVSNMVTGGLVSGIGWVLGAQPVQRPEEEGS